MQAWEHRIIVARMKEKDTKQVISRPDGMQDTKNARDNRSLWIFRDSH